MERDSRSVSNKRPSRWSIEGICGGDTKLVKVQYKPKTSTERSRLHRERMRLKKFPNTEKKINLFKSWCDEKRRQDSAPTTHSQPSSKDDQDQFGPRNLKEEAIPSTYEFPILGPEDSVSSHKRTTGRKIPDRTTVPSSTETCSNAAMKNEATSVNPSSGEILRREETRAVKEEPKSEPEESENSGYQNYPNGTDGVLKKKRLKPILNSVNKSGEGTRTIKEEPMSEPEEDGTSGYQTFRDPSTATDTRPGVSSVVLPTIVCVKSLSERSSGEILGIPVDELPSLPCPPPSQSVSRENPNATYYVQDKNRLQPNLNFVTDSLKETIKEEPMSEPEDGGASGFQNVYALPTVTDTVSRPGASTVIVPSVLCVKSLSERSSEETLRMPVRQLPSLPCDPPVRSVSGYQPNVTNDVLEKNWFHPNPNYVNECREVTKVLPEYKTRELDAFGKYIASKLRNLDWRTCAHVQNAFNDIIYHAEMGKDNQGID